MDWASLNVFQRLTRQWDSIHPYNAAQAMKLSGAPDMDRLRSTYESTLRELGLGAAEVRGSRFRWHRLALDHRPSLSVPPGTNFSQWMSHELNEPFAEDSIPFRPFVISENADHYAGVVYHHWAADSYSIRLLLHEWFLRLYEPSEARREPLRIATRGFWRLFGPGQAGWKLEEGLLGVFRWSARFRRARRIEPSTSKELQAHFSLHQAPDGLISSVAAAAKRKGVTVNDVFLATMATVCDKLVPTQRTRKRPDLGLGTIVDLRSKSRQRMEDQFGLFLGFTSVFCRQNDLADWNRLLARVHQQNQMQKHACAAESSMVRMLSGLLVARIIKKQKLLEFYRKRLALTAGISNVNLNREWPRHHHPSPLLDYVRVSPAGPMMPVVFTPTTLGNQLNIGLTCRASVVSPSLANELARQFLGRLEWFASR